MRWIFAPMTVAALCVGCSGVGSSRAEIELVGQSVAADNAACRIYSINSQVDGVTRNLVGRACKQADGAWQVAEGPPDNPAVFQTLYRPDPSAVYEPWGAGPPIGISAGRPVTIVIRGRNTPGS